VGHPIEILGVVEEKCPSLMISEILLDLYEKYIIKKT
jgi:hypothetical protein